MAAPKGNRFWEARAKHGRDKIFKTPAQMWEAACEYFEWVEEHPLWENKVAQFQGAPVDMPVAKMRAMTIEGLCLFWGVNTKYLTEFESNLELETQEGKDFSDIVGLIRSVIRSQKFAGAAADLLNANIIARELGLKDASQHEHTGADGGPIETTDLTERELARRIAYLLNSGIKSDHSNSN